MKNHVSSKNIAHISHGDQHAVAAALHVLVMPSRDGGYFAQGLEIDYVATGATEEAAQNHFALGFVETVKSYLRRGRDISSLYGKSKAPGEYWAAYYAANNKQIFGCVVGMDLGDVAGDDVALPRKLNFIPALTTVAG